MATLASLTERTAVLKAIAEYDKLGAEGFLERYGYGRARKYLIHHEGKYYDSKAIAGVAVGHQHGTPLRASEFTGGLHSVVQPLRSLGFTVVHDAEGRWEGLPEELVGKFEEGAAQQVTVNRYERSGEARRRCLELHGTTCAVCEFVFAEGYGEAFAGLIHVHHIVPLGVRRVPAKVDPERDLIPVCPNCHAAIHWGGENRSIEEMRRVLGKAPLLTSPVTSGNA